MTTVNLWLCPHYKIKYSCGVPIIFFFTSVSYTYIAVAVGGLFMPSYHLCSKCGELLATGQLSNSSPNHRHIHQHIFRQAHFACHCTPLFTRQKAFCSTSLIGVLGPVCRQVPRHRPLVPILLLDTELLHSRPLANPLVHLNLKPSSVI